MRSLLLLALLLCLMCVTGASAAAETGGQPALQGWSVIGIGGARADLQFIDGVLRINYERPGNVGYLMLSKTVNAALPGRYALKFKWRGQLPDFDLELRVTDIGVNNVWWWRRFGSRMTDDWDDFVIPSSALELAWGESPEPLRRVRTVEWLLTPAGPGRGMVELRDFGIVAKPPVVDPPPKPAVRASSSRAGHPPGMAIDTLPGTAWRSAAGHSTASLTVDFGGLREFGGLALDWCPEGHARDYEVQLSKDGLSWRTDKRLSGRLGGRESLFLPYRESRYLRLNLLAGAPGHGFCLRHLEVLPIGASATPNAFFATAARAAPPGSFPKYLLGQQTYFTVIGAPDGAHQALLNEEGALETDRGRSILEPFLFRDGELVTWHDVRLEQSLEPGGLPIPSVTWHDRDLKLRITGFATGNPESALHARYRIENTSSGPVRLKFFLALRPFQVNPPWQSLNMTGGFAPIHALEWAGNHVRLDGVPTLIPLTPPAGFGVTDFGQGEIVENLRHGRLPPAQSASDADGLAAAALAYELTLPAGGLQEYHFVVPWPVAGRQAQALDPGEPDAAAARLRRVAAEWERTLAGPELLGPPEAQGVLEAVRANLAYIIINRDPPALQPGPRAYARAWIRDGAVMASALLAMGHAREAREFIEWYAGFQRPDGTIPCCVDRRGPDQQVEHDSHGEFIFAVAEVARQTHDLAFLRRLWPAVSRTVAAIDRLRRQNMTEGHGSGPHSVYYGLMPESISHEGYAGHPVHAFWDGFWTLRGLKDAVELAGMLGDQAAVDRYQRILDEFRRDLYVALERTIAEKPIDYLPGSVELGDYDVNATAASINIAGEEERLPTGPLARTFDQFADTVRKRRLGQLRWDAYTPYEVRSVEALVRLGRREQALELLDFLMSGQRPAAWRHWAEVVWRDPRSPRFFGDMPHAWIGAEFIRAVRAMYLFERERDQSLVLAAGIPDAWLRSGGELGVRRMPTRYGELSYSLRRTGARELSMNITGKLRQPPGGIVLQPPLGQPLRGLQVNGRALPDFASGDINIRELPAEVRLRW